MGLRPARTCRTLVKVAWSRFSQKRPKKSFVKTRPHSSLNVFHMGIKGNYELQTELVAAHDLQIRDNSLEAARQAINKHLEKTIPGAYYFYVATYPHNIIRENKMILGAGADRLQKGMRKAFGRATNRAARLHEGSRVFVVCCNKKEMPIIQEAYRRAKIKMPGKFRVMEKKMN